MQQAKTLSASIVKNNFGEVVTRIQKGEYNEVIVENRGTPVAAIVNVEDLELVKVARENKRRQEALNLLRNAREKVQARLQRKMTEKKASIIANRFSREFVEDLKKEGKVKFER